MMLAPVGRSRMQTMFALNFYSPIVADQLRSRRKTATIRLGDKSAKYKKGMIVAVLAGSRYSPREKIFDAVIDKVEVKTLGELSPREIEHDNPEIRLPLVEVALGEAAAEANGDPVAERLAPLLAQPVGGLAHPSILKETTISGVATATEP